MDETNKCPAADLEPKPRCLRFWAGRPVHGIFRAVGWKGIAGADYEFRFHSSGMLRAVHVVRLLSDSEACVRAHKYLEVSPEFDSVIVRSGFRFMREIACVGEAQDEERPKRRLLS
jgi:hypothetical protein